MLHCPPVHNNSNTKVQAQLPKGFSVWGAIFVHPGGTCLPQEIIDFLVTWVLHGSLPLWATEPIEHGATQNIKFLWKCDASTYPYLFRNSKFELEKLVFFIAQHVHAASSKMFYLGYSLRFWNDSWLMFRSCLLWSCSWSQRKKEDDPLQNITKQQHLKSNDQLPGWNQAWNVLGWLNHGCWQSLLDESRRCKHYPTQ